MSEPTSNQNKAYSDEPFKAADPAYDAVLDLPYDPSAIYSSLTNVLKGELEEPEWEWVGPVLYTPSQMVKLFASKGLDYAGKEFLWLIGEGHHDAATHEWEDWKVNDAGEVFILVRPRERKEEETMTTATGEYELSFQLAHLRARVCELERVIDKSNYSETEDAVLVETKYKAKLSDYIKPDWQPEPGLLVTNMVNTIDEAEAAKKDKDLCAAMNLIRERLDELDKAQQEADSKWVNESNTEIKFKADPGLDEMIIKSKLCSQIGCSAIPVYEVWNPKRRDGPFDFTSACTAHLGELLSDPIEENRIHPYPFVNPTIGHGG